MTSLEITLAIAALYLGACIYWGLAAVAEAIKTRYLLAPKEGDATEVFTDSEQVFKRCLKCGAEWELHPEPMPPHVCTGR